MSKINLFCLPFSGGSQYSYNTFKQYVPQFISLKPLDFPGRGARISENLLTDINRIVDDVYRQIKGELYMPYAIYGHSMGTLVAYLLVKKLQKENAPLPIRLFLTGSGGPLTQGKETDRHLLSKADFKAKLREYGGSPNEVLENDALFDFFEPILRADFKAVETYIHEESQPFSIPITVMIGKDEKTTEEEAKLWQEETAHQISLHQFSGGHFFIYQHEKEIMDIISKDII